MLLNKFVLSYITSIKISEKSVLTCSFRAFFFIDIKTKTSYSEYKSVMKNHENNFDFPHV